MVVCTACIIFTGLTYSCFMKSVECFLIDDDRDDHDLFKMVLESMDVPVHCRVAKNGSVAVKILAEESSYYPDFIFIDVNMPKMSGLECLAEIKKIMRLNKVKIYMFSTSADHATIEASKDLGAEDFMIKPSRLDDLKSALSGIFKRLGK